MLKAQVNEDGRWRPNRQQRTQFVELSESHFLFKNRAFLELKKQFNRSENKENYRPALGTISGPTFRKENDRGSGLTDRNNIMAHQPYNMEAHNSKLNTETNFRELFKFLKGIKCVSSKIWPKKDRKALKLYPIRSMNQPRGLNWTRSFAAQLYSRFSNYSTMTKLENY